MDYRLNPEFYLHEITKVHVNLLIKLLSKIEFSTVTAIKTGFIYFKSYKMTKKVSLVHFSSILQNNLMKFWNMKINTRCCCSLKRGMDDWVDANAILNAFGGNLYRLLYLQYTQTHQLSTLFLASAIHFHAQMKRLVDITPKQEVLGSSNSTLTTIMH